MQGLRFGDIGVCVWVGTSVVCAVSGKGCVPNGGGDSTIRAHDGALLNHHIRTELARDSSHTSAGVMPAIMPCSAIAADGGFSSSQMTAAAPAALAGSPALGTEAWSCLTAVCQLV